MTEITLRQTKGAPLTHDELDANFSNLKETADLAYDASVSIGGKATAAVVGVDDAATDLGTFTGSTISDNATAKGALQELETALESTSGDAATKTNATAIGIAATDADMGTPASDIYTPNGTAKDWLEEAGAAIEARTKVSDLAASTALGGANLVGFTHDGVTTGTLAAAWRLHANPMNAPWNAAGDGITDDTEALQDCLDWIKATIGGGVMDITHPHLIDSADLIVPRYVSLRMRLGTGSLGNPSFFGHTGAYADLAAAPKILVNAAYSIIADDTGGSSSYENIIIAAAHLNFDGDDEAVDYAGTGVVLTTTSGVTFKNCTFLGFDLAVFSDGSSQIRWEQCQFDCTASTRQKNGFDINTHIDCRSYNFLQSGITGNTDARTKRDGSAYKCDGASNGGHQFINCFAYGYRWAFDMQTAGSYSFPGCWADGGKDATTGRSYWSDGVGFNLVSGNLNDNAECQISNFKASAQATGVYVGADMYGATLISGFHMWECNDSIVCDNPNVLIAHGAIRGYYDSGVKFGDAASANGSRVSDVLFYDRQGAPNTPVEIDCGTGSPVIHNVRYAGGVISFANLTAYTVTPASELITYDFDRDFMFVDGTGVVGDATPKVAGKVIGFAFLQDAASHFGGPDGPSTFYNATSGGNFQTKGPFRATAGSVIWFYRNKTNDKWIELGRTLYNNTPPLSLRVVTATGAVTVSHADSVIVVNKGTGAATAVNLPTGTPPGKRYIIKDGKGDAAANNITITPASGTIDGAATLVVNTNYGSATIVYNGTQWNAI